MFETERRFGTDSVEHVRAVERVNESQAKCLHVNRLTKTATMASSSKFNIKVGDEFTYCEDCSRLLR
jgi:hypothetical protein